MNFSFCKIFFIFCLFFANSALCAPKKAKKTQDKTRITSDIMDIKRKVQTIDFLGNVVVKNGPDSMTAQKMTVFYEDSTNSNKSQGKSDIKAINQKRGTKSSIKRIEAEKDVKIFSVDFVASSDFGHYDPRQNLFILEKNVIVNSDDSIGTGEKFIYNLTTRKGNFVGKSDSVRPDEDRRVKIIIGNETIKGSKKQKK